MKWINSALRMKIGSSLYIVKDPVYRNGYETDMGFVVWDISRNMHITP